MCQFAPFFEASLMITLCIRWPIVFHYYKLLQLESGTKSIVWRQWCSLAGDLSSCAVLQKHSEICCSSRQLEVSSKFIVSFAQKYSCICILFIHSKNSSSQKFFQTFLYVSKEGSFGTRDWDIFSFTKSRVTTLAEMKSFFISFRRLDGSSRKNMFSIAAK